MVVPTDTVTDLFTLLPVQPVQPITISATISDELYSALVTYGGLVDLLTTALEVYIMVGLVVNNEGHSEGSTALIRDGKYNCSTENNIPHVIKVILFINISSHERERKKEIERELRHKGLVMQN